MEALSGIQVAFIPAAQIVILSLGTLSSFLVALKIGDVSIYLPFISETGAVSPECGILSLSIIFGTILGGVISVLLRGYRYQQKSKELKLFGVYTMCVIMTGLLAIIVRYLIVSQEAVSIDKKILVLNKVALYLGIVSMAGLATVAAFPMSTVLVVHLIGAGVHFSLGMVYVLLHSVITYKMKISFSTSAICSLRIVLSVLIIIFLILLMICYPIAYFTWKANSHQHSKRQKTPEDKGFTILFVSSVCEWLLYVVFLTFFLTFIPEFRRVQLLISVRREEVITVEDRDARPSSIGTIYTTG